MDSTKGSWPITISLMMPFRPTANCVTTIYKPPVACCMRMIRIVALLSLGCFCTGAFGQSVRVTQHGQASWIREATKEAEKLGRTDWPLIRDGESGTIVKIVSDYDDADAILLTS